jgi:diguanylate cyclase (GGDEF)-like protein
MIDPIPPLLKRAQSAPLFLLSFKYRDELAEVASEAGWHVIAARRSEGAEQRFIASGAIIAIIDIRGAGKAGLAAVMALSEAVEVNGAALLVLGAGRSLTALEDALSAGATHVLKAPISPAAFVLSLRSAERFALRLLSQSRAPQMRSEVWRDQQLGWEEHNHDIRLSPALAERLKLKTRVISSEKMFATLPIDAQQLLALAITQVRGNGQPRALTHRLLSTDAAPIAHHIRLNPQTKGLEGLIELPRSEAGKSLYDALTGLRTATAARQWLDQHDQPAQTILLVGFARFEMINGAFGRMTGDTVLRALARRIDRIVEKVCPASTLTARIAGATFLIALDASTLPINIATLADQLTEALERPVIADGHEVSVGCCIGGVNREAGEESAALIHRASEALAAARQAGAHAIDQLETQKSSATISNTALETDLRNALDRNEIDILFQPQVAISTGKIVGVEALARWAHPELGTLGAGTLFAVAERSDYLNALSAHIQKRAAQSAARWPDSLAQLRLAINITAQDMARSGFAQSFLKMIDSSGFPRERLTVEITESGLIDNLAEAADLLAALRQAGCRVAIDDFGTGYSSLAYLKALPLDYLKIDKAMAQDIVGTTRDKVVVRGVIDMARSLGLSVIAEGVETEEQRAALAEQGANYYQGFLCAEPLDVAALEKLVISR